MHRGRKYSGIKKPITRAIGASLVTAEVQPDLSPHDKKELARFVRKYGRRAIVHAAQTIPLPEKRGRRLGGVGRRQRGLHRFASLGQPRAG